MIKKNIFLAIKFILYKSRTISTNSLRAVSRVAVYYDGRDKYLWTLRAISLYWCKPTWISQIYSKGINPNWFDFHCLSIWSLPISWSSLSIFVNIIFSQSNTLQPISWQGWAFPCLPLAGPHSFLSCRWPAKMTSWWSAHMIKELHPSWLKNLSKFGQESLVACTNLPQLFVHLEKNLFHWNQLPQLR